MKTTTTEKLILLQAELKAKRSVYIRIAGITDEFLVKDVRKRQSNLEFQLVDRGGRLIVDPDDIRAIRLHEAI